MVSMVSANGLEASNVDESHSRGHSGLLLRRLLGPKVTEFLKFSALFKVCMGRFRGTEQVGKDGSEM